MAGGTTRVLAWLPGPGWHAENPGTCLFVLVGAPEIFSKNATFVCITVSWLLTDTGGAEDAPFLAKYFSFSWGFVENIVLKNARCPTAATIEKVA